ncbi:MAG: NlpC/P60 family protein [Coriobacteriales bacterium]
MEESLNRRAFLGAAIAGGIAGLASLVATPSAHAVTSAEKRAEVQAAKARLDSMTSQLEQTVSQFNAAQDAYDAAAAKVAECQVKIDEATAKISSLQGRLGNRATAMYREGATSYLDVLMGSSSFDDFASTWDMLDQLNADDATLVNEAKETKAQLDAAKEELDANEQAAQAELSTQAELKASIEAQEAAYQAEYNSLSSEYQQLIAQEREAEAQRQAAASAAYTPSMSSPSSGSSSSSGGGGYSSSSSIPTNGSVVDYAVSRLGCPYVWGASGPNTFDCSGLTMWCYAQIGISLPHYDRSQYAAARARLNPRDAAPGDILWRPGHVAISTGGTNYIHAPRTGDVVRRASGGNWVCALRF